MCADPTYTVVVYAGGPCTCKPGRYVRFVIPAVPGCEGVISCQQEGETRRATIIEHAIPVGVEIAIRCPQING